MRRKKKSWLKRFFSFCFLVGVVGIILYSYSVKQQVEQINQWEKTVDQAVKKQNIPEYKDLALAIIMAESKGNQIDIMQSSESQFGEQNHVKNQHESIQYGVAFLAQAVKKAQTLGIKDKWAIVQSYNFGLNYLDYVSQHGNKNTLKLAERYSKEKLAPMLGNKQQKTYRYWHLPALLYNGGYIYQNGGNMFYADIVKWNMIKLHKVSEWNQFLRANFLGICYTNS